MTDRHQKIVVGVDGSEASKAALRWAIDEAKHRVGSTVVALHVWQFPVLAFDWYGAAAAPMLAPHEVEKLAERAALQTIQDVAGDDLSVSVVSDIRNGHAGSQLVEAGKDADLLVVGSAGHGGFSDILLGSVSMHVVHHATCPVVVVRPTWTPPTERAP